MTRRSLPHLAAAVLALVAVTGCDSILDTDPEGQIVIENAFATPEGQVLYLNSLYDPLTTLYGSFNGPMQSLLESGTDDAFPLSQTLGGFKERTIDPGAGALSGVYTNNYNGLQRANTVLARTGTGGADFAGREALQNQIRGEALFFRAFYYFNLVRVFGDVPLFTAETNSIPDAQQARAPTAEVYARIKADLDEAIPLLPVTYTGVGSGQEFGRVTQGAARTLYAYVHLTLQEWDAVLAVTDPIAGYSLRPLYGDNFYGLPRTTGASSGPSTAGENKVESIFEVQYTALGTGPKSQIRVSYAPSGVRDGQAQILPTDAMYDGSLAGSAGPNGLVQAFEAADKRGLVTLSKYGRTTTLTRAYPGAEFFVLKWYSDVPNNATSYNIPLYRYADVLLMRAEALAELGRGGEALAIVNGQIRQRAGVGPTTETDAVQAVRLERRREFAFEYKRFFDLNRWGTLAPAVAQQGITISGSKITANPMTGLPQVLYPIPAVAMQRNPRLTQNQGY